MANILSLGAQNSLSIKLLDPYLMSSEHKGLPQAGGDTLLRAGCAQLHLLCRARLGKHLTGQKSCPTWTSILRMTQKGPLQSSCSVPEAAARCLAFLNAVQFILLYSFLKYPEKV